VTSFRIEYFTPPASARSERVLRFSREQADDHLAGRTVWCGVETPAGTAARPLEVPADEALSELAARLDGALRGAAAEAQLGAAERDLCMHAADIVAARVAPDDIVILHDALTVLVAAAARERGAHTIWLISTSGPASEAIDRAERLMQPFTSSLDAYVTAWRDAVAARMPSADVVTVKSGPDAELDWNGILADVLTADRAQTVGGTLHARPTVAAR
jgi:hypothetical protein